MNFEFEYPEEYETQNILLYYDEPGQWTSVYNTDKSCYQKESVLKPENNQVINLTTRYSWSGCSKVERDSKNWLVCKGGRSFRSVRERWWFIAVSNCESNKGLSLNYKLHMTNSNEDDWQKEFSADEFYILQVDIGFFLLFVLLLAISSYVASLLRSRQLFHTTFKMYMTALAFECVYLLIKTIAFAIQKDTGMRYEAVLVLARVFQGISLVIFLLMLILMGKGYTITRGRLSHSGSVKITVFISFYSISFIVVFVNELFIRDPGEQLYLYENIAGYILISKRLLGWLWFCYAIFFTLKNYPEKNAFYYPFFIIYTCWFWLGPIIIFIAMTGIPLWMREKTVNGVEHLVDLIGFMIFLVLTRPTSANSNFPYHVRTSQIGVMLDTDVPSGASRECQSFSGHAYAPSTPLPPAYDEIMGATNETSFSDMFCVENSMTRQNGHTRSKQNGVSIDKFPHDKSTNKKNLYNKFLANGTGESVGNGHTK